MRLGRLRAWARDVDWEQVGFGTFIVTLLVCLVVLVVAFVLVLGVAGFDEIQVYRARHGIFACEARNLQPVRKPYSAQVACRARNLGADTLTVKQVAP